MTKMMTKNWSCFHGLVRNLAIFRLDFQQIFVEKHWLCACLPCPCSCKLRGFEGDGGWLGWMNKLHGSAPGEMSSWSFGNVTKLLKFGNFKLGQLENGVRCSLATNKTKHSFQIKQSEVHIKLDLGSLNENGPCIFFADLTTKQNKNALGDGKKILIVLL